MLKLASLSVLFWLPFVPAVAEAPCGTIVLPPGIGVSEPTAVTGLNPLIGSSLYNAQIQNVIFRPLIWVDQDHGIDRNLSIADTITPSADTTVFHVTMKHWQWSDGAPITADDVLYCYELILKLGETWGGKGQADMPDIITAFTVTAPDAFDVRLAHPVNPRAFILNGLGAFVPLPRHAWRDTSTDELWRRQTDLDFLSVVSGPYRVADFQLARYLTMRANPNYSGPDKPTVAKIIVNFLEGTDELRAIQTGDVDAANIPFPTWDAAQKLPGLMRVPVSLSYSFNNITLNLKNAGSLFFQELAVRQAMADAIDQKEIVDLVYHGSGVVAYGPVPPEPASGLSPSARAGKYPVGYDPDRARKLLDDAGWVPGPDGVRVKDGVRLSFTNQIPAGRAVISEGLQVIQRNFAAVGIEMKLIEVQFNQLLPILFGHPDQWEAISLGWTLPAYPEGQTLFGTGGVNNNGGYSDPKMDRLTAAMTTEPGDQALFDFQDYASEQQPIIFYALQREVLMVRPGVEGFDRALTQLGFWAPEYLRLTGERACHAGDRKPS